VRNVGKFLKGGGTRRLRCPVRGATAYLNRGGKHRSQEILTKEGGGNRVLHPKTLEERAARIHDRRSREAG